MSDELSREIADFFSQCECEVDEFLERIGSEAVAINRASGNYQDRTGNLRRSNYYKVTGHTLTVGNKAGYASSVSSRGYDVTDTGVQYLKKQMEDML